MYKLFPSPPSMGQCVSPHLPVSVWQRWSEQMSWIKEEEEEQGLLQRNGLEPAGGEWDTVSWKRRSRRNSHYSYACGGWATCGWREGIKKWSLEMEVSKEDFWVLLSLLCICCSLRKSLGWRPTFCSRVLELGEWALGRGCWMLRETVLKIRTGWPKFLWVTDVILQCLIFAIPRCVALSWAKLMHCQQIISVHEKNLESNNSVSI